VVRVDVAGKRRDDVIDDLRFPTNPFKKWFHRLILILQLKL